MHSLCCGFVLQLVYRDSASSTACAKVSRKCAGCSRAVNAEARYCDWCGSQVRIQALFSLYISVWIDHYLLLLLCTLGISIKAI